MEQVFIYLFKSSGLIAMFYLAYHFLVRKETFFNSNRWFLLSGLLTSLLLPLYFLKRIIMVERPRVPVHDFVVTSQQPIMAVQNVQAVEAFDWMQLLWISYFIIACVLVLKIVLNLTSLYRMLHKQQAIKKEQFKLVDLNDNIAPFSFFNYIVYNSGLYSDEELQSILLHEKIHSKDKHSLDILISEMFCALFWFNPFVWLYKKAITQNLEYIADQKAIEQLEDKKSYQHALLKVVSNQNCLPITNNFYQSLIKKRIVMLNKNQSHKRSYLKYALIVPVLIGFVILFQVKIIAQEQDTVLPDGSTISSASREVTDMIWDKNTSDKELKNDADQAKEANVLFDFSAIKRNSKDEIVAITISCKDDLGNDFTKTFSNTQGIEPIHFVRDIDQKGKGKIGFFTENETPAQKDFTTSEENYVFDKFETDENLRDDVADIQKTHNINFAISNVKRNASGEIIAIKMAFDDKKGTKGKVEQNRTIPIRPIFFKVNQQDGKNIIGFYDNSDMVPKPADPINENKITTIESIKNDALIYVDGQRYTKESLNELDPKGLEKIEILKDAKSLMQYGAKDKGEVIVITTNWTTKSAVPKQQNAPSLFTLENGDEIVVFDRYNMKIAGYPPVIFTDSSPVLVLNGVQQKNPRLTLERMPLSKIKTIKILNENDKEVKGTQIYKLIVTTK